MCKKFLKKLFMSSTFLLIPISLFGIASFWIKSNFDTISKTNNDLQTNDAKVIDNKISSFNDYSMIANSIDYAPVVTANGMLGMSNDKKTLAVTTFEGILAWENKITENEDIKNFYEKNYSNIDISSYEINNYIYLPDNNVVVVLFGSSNNTNQILFGLNYNTGVIYNPINGEDTIVKAEDGITHLYLNSSNNILGTSGKQYSEYKSKTQLFTVNEKQGISSIDVKVAESIGKNDEDNFVYLIQGYNNVNFAAFIANNTTSSGESKNREMYIVAVNDYLVPILNGSSEKITFSLGNYVSTKSDGSIDWTEVVRYQSTMIIANDSDIIFTAIVPGEQSSILKMKYSFSSKTYEKKWSIDFNGNKTINTFVYDESTKRIFLSYKKSNDGIAIERYNMDANSTPTAEVLERTTNSAYYDSSTQTFTKPILIAPVITTLTLANPNPYLIVYPDKGPEGRYFTSQSEIFTTNISFKRYESPKDRIMKDQIYTKNIPSSVSNNKLLEFISFSSALSGYQSSVQNRTNNDEYGTMYFEYSISYTNWYDTSTKSTFILPVNITGMYAINQKYKFNFVTGLTGDTTNDEKYKKIQNIISTTYAIKLTKQEVLDNFLIYDIKDLNNQTFSITTNDIAITILNSGYSVRVSVTIKSDNLPQGLKSKTYTQDYSGFKTVSGYEFGTNFQSSEANAIKNSSYASELDLYDFLNYFLNLGNKWNKDLDKWKFSMTSNNYTGSAYVTLEYLGNEDDFPTGQVNKKVLDSQEVSGFKTIPSQFKSSNLKITPYSGSSTPSTLWKLYQQDKVNSTLSKSIVFPYITDNQYLDITATNEETMDEDGYIDLSISLKDNAQTILPISNTADNPFFVYNSEAKTYFTNIFPFKVKWEINSVNYDFQWITNNGVTISPNEDFNIDLRTESYDGINSNMYANEVTDESIDKLFKSEEYIVNKEITPNVSKGTLKVIITLSSPTETYNLIKTEKFLDADTNETNNNSKVKVIYITHFKVPMLASLETIPIVFLTILGFTFLMVVTSASIYLFSKRKYVKEHKKIVKSKK